MVCSSSRSTKPTPTTPTAPRRAAVRPPVTIRRWRGARVPAVDAREPYCCPRASRPVRATPRRTTITRSCAHWRICTGWATWALPARTVCGPSVWKGACRKPEGKREEERGRRAPGSDLLGHAQDVLLGNALLLGVDPLQVALDGVDQALLVVVGHREAAFGRAVDLPKGGLAAGLACRARVAGLRG